MNKKMNFKYFYGTEADQFSFYRIPKALFTNDCFKDLSSDAKILYGLMLDRMSLSIKNQWFDEENRAYIYFSIEDIMELLNCGRNKAVKSLQELDDEKGIGLIEKRRQGFGKVTIIYVKSFIQEKCEEEKKEKSKMVKFINQTSVAEEETEEVYISNFEKSQKQTSRSPENKLQEVYISNSNNTNINNTNLSENKSNHIVSADGLGSEEDEMETLHAYQSLIKENLDYDSLLVSHPHDKNQIDEIVDLIVETVMCKSDKVLIASNWYSGALVRGKFMKLDYSHVEYVFDCENQYGEIAPQQEKALEALGFELPEPEKPVGRKNNRKMTFDSACRVLLFDVAKKHGLQLEEEPEYGGRAYLEKQDYILFKQKEQLAAQEQKLEELTMKIEDVEALVDEVADIAYNKAVEVVADTVKLETHKEDIKLVEQSKAWVLSPERKASKKEVEYAVKRLDGVIARITNAMKSTIQKIQTTLMKPEVKKAGTEQIKKKAKSSIIEQLSRKKKEIAEREVSRTVPTKSKRQDMEL